MNPILNPNPDPSPQKKVPPPHKSESQFRRYENHLINILANWPATTEIKTGQLASTTFLARIRDAILSVLEFGWRTSIDLDELKRIHKTELHFTAVDEKTIKAFRQTSGSKVLAKTGVSEMVSLGEQFCCEISNPERHVVHSLAILLSNKVLTKPAKIYQLNPDILKEVLEKHDVASTTEGDFTILI